MRRGPGMMPGPRCFCITRMKMLFDICGKPIKLESNPIAHATLTRLGMERVVELYSPLAAYLDDRGDAFDSRELMKNLELELGENGQPELIAMISLILFNVVIEHPIEWIIISTTR